MPRVEQQVWDCIRSLLSNPDLLRQHFEASRGDPALDSRDERGGRVWSDRSRRRVKCSR